jgi:hypothetical protein
MKKNFIVIGLVWLTILLISLMPVTAAISISMIDGEKQYLIYGSDEADGFRKRGDTIRSVVLIEQDGSDPDITPGQIKYDTDVEFDSCSEVNATHVLCVHDSPYQTFYDLDELNTRVNVYDDYGMIVDSSTKMLRVDEEDPTFEKLVVSQDSSGAIFADVVLVDTGVAGKDYCSGFSEFEVKDGSTTIVRLDRDDLGDLCRYENSALELPIAVSGRRTLTFIVVDGVGNRFSLQRVVDVDKTAPAFKSLRLLNSNGVEIRYARANSLYELDAEIELESDDTVELNATFKGFVEGEADQEKIGQCTKVRQRVVCSFSDVELQLSASQTIRVEYVGLDSFKNVVEGAQNYEIIIDGDSPIVNYFGTIQDVRDEDDNLYVGRNATFILDYTDYGIGVDKNSVFAVYDSYETGANKKTADMCDKSISRCYWYATASDTSAMSAFLGIHGASGDTLGNPIDAMQLSLRIDADDPYIIGRDKCEIVSGQESRLFSYNINDPCADMYCDGFEDVSMENASCEEYKENVFGCWDGFNDNTQVDVLECDGTIQVTASGSSRTYIKGGDNIDVSVEIADDGVGLDVNNVYLDVSDIMPGFANKKGSCSPSSSGYTCTWNNVGPLANTFEGDSPMRELAILAADRVGNVGRLVKSMSVYRNPDIPSNVITGIGKYEGYPGMDRQIMEIYSVPIIIPIFLKDKDCGTFSNSSTDFGCSGQDDRVNIIDAYFKENGCLVSGTASGDDGSGYISYLELDPPYHGMPDLVKSANNDRLMFAKVKFKDASDSPDEDWIEYSCSMVVISERNGYVYEELESFEFKIDFIKNGLGDIPAELVDEITNARERASGPIKEVIDYAGKAVDTVQNLCNVYSQLSTVIMTISFIVDGLGSTGFTKPYAVALGGTEEAIKIPMLEAVDQFVGPACRFVNCEHCQWTGDEADEAGFWPSGDTQLSNTGVNIGNNPPDANEFCAGTVEVTFGDNKGENKCCDRKAGSDGGETPIKCNLCCLLRQPMCLATYGARQMNEWTKLGDGAAENLFQTDTSLNPKESFGLSVLTLCIPGIITGLQKRRHMECRYIRCLEEDVPLGTDPSVCKAERAFNNCLWWGESLMFFAYIVPGVKLLEMVGELFQNFINNPLQTAIGVGYKIMCGGTCGAGWNCWVCSAIQIIDVVADTINTVVSFVDQGWSDMMENNVWPDSPCDGLFDEE